MVQAEINNRADQRITVGQLKQALADYDDTLEIVVPILIPDPLTHEYLYAGVLFEIAQVDLGGFDDGTPDVVSLGVTVPEVFQPPAETGTGGLVGNPEDGGWVPAV